ncbi:MAG: alkaline shock response membrane anchor protein AmaP [Candidatus Omnitrophica bacterium]|nr:alkaline shock response membrane anchor protein AmaP [Candidatus Omnitrophota bacterium]
MKIFSRIVAWIYGLTSLIVAFFCLALWAKMLSLEQLQLHLERIDLTTIGIIGTSLIILGMLWLLFIVDYLHKSRAISFDNPGGEVKVALSAIEDFIVKRVLAQIKAVKRITTKAFATAKGLKLINRVVLWSDNEIPGTCGAIQDLIKKYLQDIVGVERISVIKVYVRGISTHIGEEEPKEEEPIIYE